MLAAAEAAAAAAAPKTVEARIQQAYARATSAKPGRDAKRTLTELRKQLTDLPRKDVDAALDRLLTAGQIRLEPEILRHRLTDEDRAAAIRLGGEDRHLIMMERMPETAHAAADLAAVAWAARLLVEEAEQDVTSLKQAAEQNCPSRNTMGDTPTQTAAEAARDLGVSVGTIYKWLANGNIRKHGVTGHKDARGRWVITLLEDAPGAADDAAAPRTDYSPAPPSYPSP